MPMTADGALWAYAHEDEYPDMGGLGEAAIREAFEVRDRARAELERLEALDLNHLSQQRKRDRDQDIAWLKRILGEEGED